MHSKGIPYNSVSHSIHKYRSLLFVSNTEHSCANHAPCHPVPFALPISFLLCYLHFNHFTKSSFLLPPVIWCISFLLLHNNLLETKTKHIYYLSFCGAGVHAWLIQVLSLGSQRMQSRCQVILIEDKAAPKTIQIILRFITVSPYEGPAVWLSVGGCPRVLQDTFSGRSSHSPSRGNSQFPALGLSQHGL